MILITFIIAILYWNSISHKERFYIWQEHLPRRTRVSIRKQEKV